MSQNLNLDNQVNVKISTIPTVGVSAQYKTIILKPNLDEQGNNILSQDMVSTANTKYVIKYDFTLDGDVTIPEGCVLEFDGGSISGEHTITGNNTGIQAGLIKIFGTDVTFDGSWNVSRIYDVWFPSNDNKAIDNLIALTNSSVYNEIFIYKDFVGNLSEERESLVSLNSNTKLNLIGSLRINDTKHYRTHIIFAIDCENVIITGGGSIIGDKDTHTYTSYAIGSDEWNHGVAFRRSNSCKIENITISKCVGDGLSVGEQCYNIVCENAIIKDVRRNGVTFNCNNGIIRNVHFESISGTNPRAAIDIEPDAEDISNISILNCDFYNTSSGIQAYANSRSSVRNITIDNIKYTKDNSLQINGFCIFINNIKDCKVSNIYYIDECPSTTQTGEGNNFQGIILKSENVIVNNSVFNSISTVKRFIGFGGCTNVDFDSCEIILHNEQSLYITSSDNCSFKNCKILDAEDTVAGSYMAIGSSNTEGRTSLLNNTFNTKNRVWLNYTGGTSRTIFISNNVFVSEAENTTQTHFVIKANRVIIESNLFEVKQEQSSDRYGTVINDGGSFVMLRNNIIFGNTNSLVTYFIVASECNVYSKSNKNINTAIKENYIFGKHLTYSESHMSMPSVADNTNIDYGAFYYNALLCKAGFYNVSLRKFTDSFGRTINLSLGGTTSRPSNLNAGNDKGFQYYDTTLNKPIWWNGTRWIDATGATV